MKTENWTGNVPAVIANGASLSDVIDIGGALEIGFQMPASWTAANLTFQGSDASDGTYNDVYDDAGNEVVVTAAQARAIVVGTTTKNLTAFRFIKIRSGTTALPVVQGAERVIQVVLKG